MSVNSKSSQTPVMRQYYEVKSKNPDAIILFRMGDFYETFDKDALIASDILGIVLTKRSNGKASNVDLAGFPYHSLDNYLPKLVKAGYKVAICEQVEDAKLVKGIVRREVVEVVTPGTIFTENNSTQFKNNYIGCLNFSKNKVGLALIDISTGQFHMGEFLSNDLCNVLLKFSPTEIVISRSMIYSNEKWFLKLRPFVTKLENWYFDFEISYELLINNFQVKSLKSFGCEGFRNGIIAGGVLIDHIKNNLNSSIKQITKIEPIIEKGYMSLDNFTIRNLEIFQSLRDQSFKGTLFDTLNKTKTPGGSRLLKHWLVFPLTNKSDLYNRYDIVSAFIKDKSILESISNSLRKVIDVEKSFVKICRGTINPQELILFSETLSKIPIWIDKLSKSKNKGFRFILDLFKNSNQIVNRIKTTISENTPNQIKSGNVILPNVDIKLDELRLIYNSSKTWIINYESGLRDKLNIPKLKIGFNRVFGYYIELSKIHIERVPDYFMRKQTLSNSERYVTDELKEYELKVLNAEQSIFDIENCIFSDLCKEIIRFSKIIKNNAHGINYVDLMTSFANIAIQNNYVRPQLSNNAKILIKEGRHPVVEKLLPGREKFIPNNLSMDSKKNQIHLITGPNMSGKSTFLRQVGLITIMAQIGSFVPAKQAKIGMVDRLFTRVGASDNLAAGESTFLVEMIESANILNNITKKSLILLDEIGRGTSTYDGLSIAWGITEYIHDHLDIKPRTLFATHYHELTRLDRVLDRLENYHVKVKEDKSDIFFMRSISKGPADKSYGIQVAKMAGLPPKVIERSSQVLKSLTRRDNGKRYLSEDKQMPIFENDKNFIFKKIKDLNINSMTPIEALKFLDKLKNEIK